MTIRYSTQRRTREMVALVLMLTVLSYAGFVTLEPALITAQVSVEDQFIISQVVTGEISFLTTATDVTMSPSIPGVSGGTSNGGTQVVVFTNDPNGYYMTLQASATPAMQGDSQGGTIPNYTPASAGVPDFTFTVGANTGEFGYTVEASTTADLDPSFLDNGSTCNTGAADAADSCWLDASSTSPGETIINRSSATADSGSTTTLKFRITITSSPSPSILADTYTATTTLTATINP